MGERIRVASGLYKKATLEGDLRYYVDFSHLRKRYSYSLGPVSQETAILMLRDLRARAATDGVFGSGGLKRFESVRPYAFATLDELLASCIESEPTYIHATPAVYFLYCPVGKCVKIGKGKVPHRRIKSIRSISPVDIHIITTVSQNDYDEFDLHCRFGRLRLRTPNAKQKEWFSIDGELSEFLLEQANVQGGRFKGQKLSAFRISDEIYCHPGRERESLASWDLMTEQERINHEERAVKDALMMRKAMESSFGDIASNLR